MAKCHNCGRTWPVVTELVGKTISCFQCSGAVLVGADAQGDMLASSPVQKAGTAGRRAIALGILGGVGMATIGAVLSQVFPVFGGFLELNLAQPLSPARLALLPIHVLVFGSLGVLFGGLYGYLTHD